MADLRPLRGVRFDRHFSGPVGPLLAPPYDVAAEPGDGAEFSIRKIEAVDVGANGNPHAEAARRYRSWLENGILRRDDAPAFYIHRHEYLADGVPVVRTGFLARVRLADWSERVVLPHERTMPGPRRERLARLRAVQANLSPLYFLFRDADGQVRERLASARESEPLADGRDGMGARHRLEAITDPARYSALMRAFRDRQVFVADGHHRYEAALAFRDECRKARGFDAEAPWEFVLALLAAVEDPGVAVRPAHRLLIGTGPPSTETTIAMLRRWFLLTGAEPGAELPEHALFRVILSDSDAVYDVGSRPEQPHLALLPGRHGAAWQSLGVSALEGVLARLIGADAASSEARVMPEVDADNALRRVRTGSAQAAFLLPPPSLDRLLTVAEEGDLLPAKATWFDPKAPAGLVINDLAP